MTDASMPPLNSPWQKILPFYFASPEGGYPDDLIQRAQNIKLLALDVDGVLTTGDISYTQEHQEIKTYNAKDGHGLWMLTHVGIVTAIITGRQSPINEKRAAELGVPHLFQGIKNKNEILSQLLKQYDLSLDEVAYMGDDLPDISILEQVGLATCPQDAVYQVQLLAHWIVPVAGGKGAVRALCDCILYSQGLKQPLLAPLDQQAPAY
jgi:3-deoxy-D-manno-octulosonate 8-phosphate phosphatase (KDO 8-P phosphatase)